eukprot:gene4601-5747_t
MATSFNPTLTYFNVRGKGEVIRLLLNYTNTTFNNIPVDGEIQDHLRSSLRYGQLPHYHDPSTGINLVQSRAILRYIADRTNTAGRDVLERAYVDEVCESIWDVINPMTLPKTEEEKNRFINVIIPRFLGAWELRINENGGKFLFGDHVTVADVSVYYAYDNLGLLGYGEHLKGYPKLEQIVKEISSHPSIVNYLQHQRPQYNSRKDIPKTN